MTTSPDVTFEPPFFILGCVRSGTTMLRNLLRQHPNLASPEETHFYRIAEPFGTPVFSQWVTADITLMRHREIDQVPESDFTEILAKSTSRADLYRRYMTNFVRRRKPAARRWFDKTPQNVYGAAIAASEIPDARFVHIVRDPVNVISSLRIGKVIRIAELAGACSYWNESAAILETLRRAYPDRLLEVRYEDVVARPHEFIERILEFIGETYDRTWFADANTYVVDHRDNDVLSDSEIDFVQDFCAIGRARYGYKDTNLSQRVRRENTHAQLEPDLTSGMPKSPVRVAPLSEIPTVRALVELGAAEQYTRKAPTRVHYGDAAAEVFRGRYENLLGNLPKQSVFELPNAIVHGKGKIIVGDAYVRENLIGTPLIEELEGPHPEPVRTLDRPTLYTMRYGAMNYGQCLTDIVPRIVEVSRAIPDCDIALHPQFAPAAREALDALGVASNRLVELDELPTRLERGLYASPCSAHPLTHSPRALELIRGLADSFIDSALPSIARTKLFVTCDEATTQRITNYVEVESFLIDSGYTPIKFSAFDLATQIRAFANAGEVIGIAGAAMANMLFCAPGTRITIIASSSLPLLHFWDLATQSKHDFRLGYFSALNPSLRFNSPFTVDIDALASLLLEQGRVKVAGECAHQIMIDPNLRER